MWGIGWGRGGLLFQVLGSVVCLLPVFGYFLNGQGLWEGDSQTRKVSG